MRSLVVAAWMVTRSARTVRVLTLMSVAWWSQRSWRESSVTTDHDRGFGDAPWPWHGK